MISGTFPIAAEFSQYLYVVLHDDGFELLPTENECAFDVVCAGRRTRVTVTDEQEHRS